MDRPVISRTGFDFPVAGTHVNVFMVLLHQKSYAGKNKVK